MGAALWGGCTDTLFGFDYDVADETVLSQPEADGNEIVIPGGSRYKVLVLPDYQILSLSALKKIGQSVKDGASVLGFEPLKTVFLIDREAR